VQQPATVRGVISESAGDGRFSGRDANVNVSVCQDIWRGDRIVAFGVERCGRRWFGRCRAVWLWHGEESGRGVDM
jgi:hypothetical protein